MKILALALTFLLLLVNQTSAADDLPSSSKFNYEHIIEASQTNTSDKYHFNRFSVTAQSPKTNINWPYDKESSQGAAWFPSLLIGENKTELKRLHFYELALSRYIKHSSTFAYKISVGVTEHQTYGNKARRSPLTLVTIQKKIDSIYTEVDLTQKSAVSTYAGDITQLQNIEFTSLKPRISWRAQESLNFRYKSEHSWLNDGNHMDHFEMSAMYGFSTGEPWIWMGPSIEHSRYQKTALGYWSPKGFKAIGLTTDVACKLTEDSQLLLGGSFQQIKENRNPSGLGYYLNTGVSFGNRETRKLSIKIESIQSEQQSSKWSSLSIYINYFGDFNL